MAIIASNTLHLLTKGGWCSTERPSCFIIFEAVAGNSPSLMEDGIYVTPEKQ